MRELSAHILCKIREIDTGGFLLASKEPTYQQFFATNLQRKQCLSTINQRDENVGEEVAGELRAVCSQVKNKLSGLIYSSLDDIHISVSKRGLYLWEPACCWIDEWKSQEGGSSIFIPRIQLSPSLRGDNYFASLFLKMGPPREAIIAHEYIHAIRAHFLSERYEEYIAYWFSFLFSTKKIDRCRFYLGPLFKSSNEIIVWCFSVIIFLSNLFFFEIRDSLFHVSITFFSLFLMLNPFARSFFAWSKLLSAIRCLKYVFEEKDIPAILVRLEDSDISIFSSLRTKKEVLLYIKQRINSDDLKFCYMYKIFVNNSADEEV